MTKSKLKALRRRTEEAGNLQDHRRVLRAAVSVLEYEMNRLEQEKASLRMLFHRKLEAWWSSPAPVDHIPFAIPDDHRASRLYLLAAIASITFETLLGAWISVTLGLPWWSGALVAVLAAVIFDGGFSLAFRQADRPKEALGKIKRWLLLPSLVGFGLSFLFLLLARTVSGDIALLLLPVFGAAL
jgi:heme A synthase